MKYKADFSRVSRAARRKLCNHVPIVTRNALANGTFVVVRADRGKQVSLCYIAFIDASHFAVAAIVWTQHWRVDDQEKPDSHELTRF